MATLGCGRSQLVSPLFDFFELVVGVCIHVADSATAGVRTRTSFGTPLFLFDHFELAVGVGIHVADSATAGVRSIVACGLSSQKVI